MSFIQTVTFNYEGNNYDLLVIFSVFECSVDYIKGLRNLRASEPCEPPCEPCESRESCESCEPQCKC